MTRPAPSLPQVLQALLALALHARHADDLQEAGEEFFGATDDLGPEHDLRSFLEWSVFDRKGAHGCSLLELLPPLALPPRLQRHVKAWARCRSTFYRVLENGNGSCALVDLLAHGKRSAAPMAIVDAPPLLQAGDLLLGRVLPWNDGHHLAGSVHVFPPGEGSPMAAFLGDLLHTLDHAQRDEFLRELPPLLHRCEQAAARERDRGVDWPGAIPPSVLDAVLEQGLLCLARGRWEQALRAFEHILCEDPLHVDARNGVGLAWLGRGDLARARRAFESILSTHPDSATALLNLGNLELCCGRVPRATALLTEAHDHAADDDTRRKARANLRVAATEQPRGEPIPCS